ncbi:MAG: GMC family oxidoreductase [Gammaproteobacteria bacterium]
MNRLERTLDSDVPVVTYRHDDDDVVVIVGSGAGGGTMADELTRAGVDVVVLEAGPRIDVRQFVNDEWIAWDLLTWHDLRDASGTSPVAQNFAAAPTWICKGVGGSTLHWAGMCPRVQPHEFKALSNYGALDGANLADWPITFEDIEPWYIRAEVKMGVSGRNGIPHHPANNVYRILELGAKRLGYRDYDTNPTAINPVPRDGRNACDQIGFCMQGCMSGAKWATFNSELPRAEATGRCELRTRCMVVRIDHDEQGYAREVVYVDGKGVMQSQKCRFVCVAGNAVETPRLLLNSESGMFPDGLANSSGQVGKNYMRHVTGNVYGTFEHPVYMNRGRQVGGIIRDESRFDPRRGFAGGYNMANTALGLPFYAAFRQPGAWGRDYSRSLESYARVAAFNFTGEDMPIETNRVSLHPSKRDQFGLPIPTLHIDDHANDLSMREHAEGRLRALVEAAGATEVFASPPLPFSHNLGTCRMSDDPSRGVVDKWGRSHDVPNLFISDGSQFTTAMAPNPTLLIVALALRQADFICREMRGAQRETSRSRERAI